ncbi:MAG: hypothetical protein JJ885_10445 [Muricauda sp.]|nr:hypothetical protein [Allomuricauda sp.]MBO6533080.1 hypothetical protein [Allomuricauda sp.]MBO6589906.1 hypothetical protein [Allomuricauda sp.]MBO6619532.1 hypothetical protein [Allomuricauda sp.]MBO6645499.1 hypothetical protein [Allomuricauda sp.]MBO6747706.1 hypothetical protein [Allomuricauda sp.]
MRMKNHFPFLGALLVVLLQSCNKETTELSTDVNNQQIESDSEKIVMGDTLDIPFTVANMQTAMDNLLFNLKNGAKKSKLSKTFKADGAIEIVPSHFYYRFLPKDSTEYHQLTNDTILQVSNIPLHLKVEEEGDYYDDPDYEGDENPGDLSYLYAVVPYDHAVPESIHKELLDNYYFAPETTKEELAEGEVAVKQPVNKTTKDLLTVDENGEVFEYLELEALKLTNNLDADELAVLRFYLPNDSSGTTYAFSEAAALGYEQKDLILDLTSIDALLEQEELASRGRWNPRGTITVQEDVVNRTVGVAGAEVKVRKWGLVVIRRAYTNSQGQFRTSSTRTKRVKYAVYFNNPHRFKVMAGTIFLEARHRGTRSYKRQPWNQNFSYGRSQFYALVHNAAYDYYTRVVPTYGLRRPRMCRISAKYNLCGSSEHRADVLTLLPTSDIRVTRNGKDENKNCFYRGTDGIYATTVHELTHAGHRELDPGMFSVLHLGNCERLMLRESWAEGVETIVTNDRYKRLNPNYLATNSFNTTNLKYWNDVKQTERIEIMTEYTPIVVDLVDNVNQKDLPNVSGNQPIDRVSGYNLSQIQGALRNCRSINCWESNLRNQYSNSTEGYLNELFNYMRAVLHNNNPRKCD